MSIAFDSLPFPWHSSWWIYSSSYFRQVIIHQLKLFTAAAKTSVVSNSVWPHRQQSTRLPHSWDSPGKNTGVGCHFLLWKLFARNFQILIGSLLNCRQHFNYFSLIPRHFYYHIFYEPGVPKNNPPCSFPN